MTTCLHKLRTLSFLTAAFATCCILLTACGDKSADKSARGELKGEVSSFIFDGQLAKADSLLHDRLKNAPDSDSYYEALSIATSLDYYSARIDSLDAKAERVMRYVASKPESQRRSVFLFDAIQAKAASFSQYRFDPDSSLLYLKKGIDCARGIDDKESLLMAYSNMADAMKNIGKFDQSMEFYMLANSLADSIATDNNNRLAIYMGIASDYTAMRDFDNSRIWWDRAAQLMPYMGFNERFQYYNNRGNDYFYGKDYAGALKVYLALDSMLDEKPEYSWEKHFCDANLSDVYLKLGMNDKAAPLIEENIDFFSNVQPNDYAATHVKTQKIDWLLSTGKTAEALRMLADNPLLPSTRPEQHSLRHDLERRLFARVGDWKRAYEALDSYHALEDSIRNAQIKMSAEAALLTYQHDAKLNNLRNEAEEYNDKLVFSYTIIVLAAILLALLVAVIILLRRMSRDREERMVRKILDLRMKSIRNRITPHFIYNILNNEILANHIAPGTGASRLIHLLRQQQMMSDHLTDSLSDELDFIDNFVALKSDSQTGPVEYVKKIDPEINPDDVTLPSMSLQIFVENAFKHGFASLPPDARRILEIRVRRDREDIVMEVCNNAAPGIKPDSESTRQGLKIISGTLQILNEKKRRKIRFSLDDWTDNPEKAGKMASLSIPNDFVYPPQFIQLIDN